VELGDIASHIAVGGGSAATMGWIAKTLLKTWMQKHEAMAAAVNKLAEKVEALTIEVTKIGVTMQRFDVVDQKTQELDKAVAVAQHRLDETQSDLNGIGRKIRTMETS
jgi:hypothetical protein